MPKRRRDSENAAVRSPTNLACRTLRRLFHSTACSSPRFYKDCKCQHTSRQSEKGQGRERLSEGDPWAANATQAQEIVWPTSVPHGTRPVFTQGLPDMTLFIQNSHFIAVRRREEPLSKEHGAFWWRTGVGKPRQAAAWLPLLYHPSWAGRLPGPRSGSSEIIWISLSQWPTWPTPFIT